MPGLGIDAGNLFYYFVFLILHEFIPSDYMLWTMNPDWVQQMLTPLSERQKEDFEKNHRYHGRNGIIEDAGDFVECILGILDPENRDAAEIRDIFSSSCGVLRGDTPLRDAHYWFNLLIRRVAELAKVYRCSSGNDDIIWQYALIREIGPRVRPAYDQASPLFLGRYGVGFFRRVFDNS